MRALRLSLAGTLMLLLLVGVVACDDDDEDGRRIELKVVEVLSSEEGTWLSEGGYEENAGHMSRAIVEASDPRLSGTWTVVETCRWGTRAGYVEHDVLCVGRVRAENEGGSWLGRHEGYRREGIDSLDPTVLEGQGDYAGLTAILDYAQAGEDASKTRSGFGYIVDFEMPPLPEPAE